MGTTQGCIVLFWTNLRNSKVYGHLLSISQTIQVRWVINARHYWWSKDILISNILLQTFRPVLVDQQNLTFIRSIQTLYAIQQSYHQEWWLIGTDGKRESKESVLSVCLGDDYTEVCIFIRLSEDHDQVPKFLVGYLHDRAPITWGWPLKVFEVTDY